MWPVHAFPRAPFLFSPFRVQDHVPRAQKSKFSKNKNTPLDSSKPYSSSVYLVWIKHRYVVLIKSLQITITSSCSSSEI